VAWVLTAHMGTEQGHVCGYWRILEVVVARNRCRTCHGRATAGAARMSGLVAVLPDHLLTSQELQALCSIAWGRKVPAFALLGLQDRSRCVRCARSPGSVLRLIYSQLQV
jgi:hypothetical protein